MSFIGLLITSECTHCNDGSDNRFDDSGNCRDNSIDAVTDGRDNGTLRYDTRSPMRIGIYCNTSTNSLMTHHFNWDCRYARLVVEKFFV
jgi:hypothetical protein